MFGEPTPGQIRAALVAHCARKLGWSAKSADTLCSGLSPTEIARCLALDPDQTRNALFARTCDALAQPVATPDALRA